jgi:hypothetical protein
MVDRLTPLTTMSQITIAIGLTLLANQGALWLEVGKVNGALVGVQANLYALNGKVDLITCSVVP